MGGAKVTAEVCVIPLGEPGRFLVYAPLRRAAFVANAETVNVLAALGDGDPGAPTAAGEALLDFLRALEILDAAPELPPLAVLPAGDKPTSVTLLLTTACNLRCAYCYAESGMRPSRSMTLETARRGIDFILQNAVEKGAPEIEVSYHGGGEPTVNWPVLTASFDYALQRAADAGVVVRSTLATNGVLTDAQIDWVLSNLHGASLSCDGTPEIHDRHRVTARGEGSSARVYHLMRRLDEAGFRYGVRVTVTEGAVSALPDSIEFLCSRFRPAQIQVEPAYAMGRWREAPSAETARFIEAFREARGRAARGGRSISFSAARLGLLTNHFCGATQDSFALSTDGNVTACYEVFSEDRPMASVFFYGAPDPANGGYRFRAEVLENLRRQAVENREYCRGCFCRWTCAGDCYHKWLSAGGTGEFAGTDRCHITRELTKDLILERIANSGGFFWHQPPEDAAPPHERCHCESPQT